MKVNHGRHSKGSFNCAGGENQTVGVEMAASEYSLSLPYLKRDSTVIAEPVMPNL
jgi:hypothetical protein